MIPIMTPANVDTSTASHTSSYSSHSDNSYDDDDCDDWGDNITQPLLGLTTGVDDNHNHKTKDSDFSEDDNVDNDDDDDNDDEGNDDNNDDEDNDDGKEHANNMSMDEDHVPKINIPDAMVSIPLATPSKNAGVGGRNKGVWDGNQNVHA